MPTERLYYSDPLLLSFQAWVVEQRNIEGRPVVVLDRSAFYPSSGGQLHDVGTINGVPVLDVYEQDEEILHVLAQVVPGEIAQGEVDWQRRFDSMQQHTGQHILSQAFIELLAAETISSHLGEEYSTIDLDTIGLHPDNLAAVEDRANTIVFEDRAVYTYFVTPQALPQIPLRRIPQGHDRIRVVEIEKYDWSACGGTHCQTTGQVGPIRIVQTERRGEETRVHFLCGWRALRDARWKHNLLAEMGSFLSVGFHDLPGAVSRLAAAEQEGRKALEKAQKGLLEYKAREYYERGEQVGPARFVHGILEQRSLEEARLLARAVAALPGGVALFGLRGEDARLCFARAEGLPWDMGALVREAAAVLGGRGGGRSHEAQGGGPEVERLEEALAVALARLHSEGDRCLGA